MDSTAPHALLQNQAYQPPVPSVSCYIRALGTSSAESDGQGRRIPNGDASPAERNGLRWPGGWWRAAPVQSKKREREGKGERERGREKERKIKKRRREGEKEIKEWRESERGRGNSAESETSTDPVLH